MLYIGNQRYKSSGSTFKTSDLYDTEVEYLQSSGTQLINTKVTGGTDCEYEIKFQLTANGNTYPHICGSTYPPTFPKILISGSLLAQYQFIGTTGNGTQYTLASQSDRNIHVAEFKDGKFYFDSVLKATLEKRGIGDIPFCIFRYLAEPTTTKGLVGRIYYCKLWKDNKLVRDLIPVRVGRVGYMYDKVSKQLFGNYYEGNFTLGPDIITDYTEVEYLESNGTQYIDTGIKINGGTDKIELTYSGFTDKYFSCGCRTSHISKAFIFSNGGTNWTTYSKYFLNYGTQNDFNITCPNDKTVHHVIMDNSVTVDNVLLYTFTAPAFTTDKTYCLFAGNTNDSGIKYGHMRIYGFKLYRNNTLIANFIPVRSNRVGYMYDKVSNTFFDSKGTNDFILGPDKEDQL